MEINNIGHLQPPADRPYSEGWGKQRRADYVTRMISELCHDLYLSIEEFYKSRSKEATQARQRVSVAAYELLRPECGVLEIAELVGLPHSTMWYAVGKWHEGEGAEVVE